MKARKKGTNDPFEEIDCLQFKDSYVLYKADMVEFENESKGNKPDVEYWEQLRHKAAIAAMQGVMNFFGSIDYNRDNIAKLAVEQADALAWLEKQKEYELPEDLGDYIAELNKQFPEVSFAKLSRIAVRVKNWLEKQGEQKPADKAKPFDKYEGLTDFERTLADICIGWIGEELGWKQYIKDNANVLLKIAIEKFNSVQDTPFEQKPIIEMKSAEESLGISSEEYNDIVNECLYGESESSDKVELKFKVGDWITNGDYTWKIIEVKPLDYILQSQDGNIVDDTISHVDEQFHSFTIKDAKDGDVLATDKSVFIYAKTLYNKPYAYCGVDKYGVSKDNCLKNNWANSVNNILPANKEQRDTLMKAMADAGYTFDFEKKELKEIEPKHEDETTSAIKNEEAYKIGFIDGEAHAKKEMELSWSEEDDYNLQCIIAKVVSDIQNGNVGRNEELIDWLKSLKPNKDMVEALRTEYEKGKADGIAEMKKHIDIMDKDNIDDFAYQCAYDLSKDWLYENASWDDVQIACKLGAKWYEAHHKVQWSEEDERMIDNIIFELEENQENISGVGYKIDWLKQLKQRIGG